MNRKQNIYQEAEKSTITNVEIENRTRNRKQNRKHKAG